jgi:hypothetical protein
MEKKSKRIELRLNEREYRNLKEQAEKSGMSVSRLIRTRVFKQREVGEINAVQFLENYIEMGKEFGKIGGNFNQLARYANHLYNSDIVQPAVVEEINRLGDEYEQLLKRLEVLLKRILKA